ncbi:cadherin repeat domain-containing protein [Sphingomonas sp. GCM10030256]|uniref:cadherin repeat domain-containing protein n=1 Tax=Sphingomonas sp. GCM10030256 TaxID=3273427 RepID=UPI0036214E74
MHINAEFAGTRPTDHYPQVALLRVAITPHDLLLSNGSVNENLLAGTVVGTLSATDTPGDVLTYALVDDADGLFAVDPKTGVVVTTRAIDFEASAGFTIMAASSATAPGCSRRRSSPLR